MSYNDIEESIHEANRAWQRRRSRERKHEVHESAVQRQVLEEERALVCRDTGLIFAAGCGIAVVAGIGQLCAFQPVGVVMCAALAWICGWAARRFLRA